MIFWKTFLQAEGVSHHDETLEAIRYQLTVLLNSEAPMLSLPKNLKQVEKSTVRFGLDSIYSISSQMDNDQFSRSMEGWIRDFEPRLSDVHVDIEEIETHKNIISFSLMARVSTETGNHALMFDSNICLANQTVSLEGQEVV